MLKKWKLALPIWNGSGWTTKRFWHDPSSIVWHDNKDCSYCYAKLFYIRVEKFDEKWSWLIQDMGHNLLLKSEKLFTERVGAKNQAIRFASKLVLATLGDLGVGLG